ncbi:hypothetical protein NFI96_009302 [Prochilodus magdalenae]|nr:hypothetical protein NFI96_009302 [Prochilodus magdalenae]
MSVETHRFLGTIISKDLSQELMVQFYTATIESAITSSITVWGSSATKPDIHKLQHIIRFAEKTSRDNLPTLLDLHTSRTRKLAEKIITDPPQPGHHLFQRLPSGRSVGYTIMGKTADWTVVQKTSIDTLHKEGTTQQVIAKEAGCSQSSVSKHINGEAKGRKRCGRCGGDSQRVDCSWSQCLKNYHARTYARHGFQLSHSLCQAKRQRQKRLTWAEGEKDWTAAEWSKVLFSDESKFCISFGNEGPRVWRKRGEAQNARCLRSSVKFPHSVMVWGAMFSAGVGPLCFLMSKVNAAVYKEDLEHFMLPAADHLYGDADFIFQQDSAPAHSAKATSAWFKDHGIPVLNLPAHSPDLNPIENLFGTVKRKMRYARPNNAEELKTSGLLVPFTTTVKKPGPMLLCTMNHFAPTPLRVAVHN